MSDELQFVDLSQPKSRQTEVRRTFGPLLVLIPFWSKPALKGVLSIHLVRCLEPTTFIVSCF
jgi:hypothetical protein